MTQDPPHGGRLIASDRGVNRRMALKVMLAAGIAPAALGAEPRGGPQPRSIAGPAGTVTDPDLRNPVVPWNRTLDEPALQTLQVLCDLILPADERLAAASELGAHDFIDEWVSAPYHAQQQDRKIVLEGLRWLDSAAHARFGTTFRAAQADQQHALLTAIARTPAADPADQPGAVFFARVRDLTAAAVWTTPEGMADLGYVGNVPLARWERPPDAVLRHLGLTV